MAIIVTVPGDSAAHTIGIAIRKGSGGASSTAVTVNGRMIRAIDLAQVTAHYSSALSNSSSGAIPTTLTDFQTATIPGSASSRTFLVFGSIVHSAGGNLRAAITLDGTKVLPTTGTLDEYLDTGLGAKHNSLGGVFVTVPGDSSSHTIGLGCEAQASTSATTINYKMLCAIDLSSVTVHHQESYTDASSGTLPSTLTDIYTVTIPASGTARTFSVDAMLCWDNVTHGVFSTITLDGTSVYPANVSADAKLPSPASANDGLTTHRFYGVQVDVPGDGVGHTIGIAGKNYSSTSAVTWSLRSISALQVA
jgi:hypothetical protein